MKRVYVCSPYRGDVEKNVAVAQAICRTVALRGDCPVAPHILLPQFLEDEDAGERELGMLCALALLELCDEVLVTGDVTEGMRTEIQCASAWGIPVVFCEAPA